MVDINTLNDYVLDNMLIISIFVVRNLRELNMFSMPHTF